MHESGGIPQLDKYPFCYISSINNHQEQELETFFAYFVVSQALVRRLSHGVPYQSPRGKTRDFCKKDVL